MNICTRLHDYALVVNYFWDRNDGPESLCVGLNKYGHSEHVGLWKMNIINTRFIHYENSCYSQLS